jgi:uroporphyrinogen decarboxylase
VFDSWASELSPYDFETFSYPSLVHISKNVRSQLEAENIAVAPMTLFAKGANHSLSLLAEKAGYDVLGLDWHIEPADARKAVGDKVTLQGNLDPGVLNGGRDAIESYVKRMCDGFKGDTSPKRWIANLGHGITPEIDPENLHWFFECVHKYSAS